eukprot:CAMPEP_0115276092 /NCGR_PEP_ID=MMETSP0270-20121206/56536_1 /TAXON_ID=71861 /ORGANISM="Scrippsiella trochoidea, Strain CCMP3099" /LENGTH=491 /DNA_ID=CAMNT_0002692671 /DNA_START=20 /DNA_END=1495 /DNA_ORIENTATION=+
MSKYGELSRTDGHSKWFLQRTLTEHDKTMDDPWMQMIYKQCFTVKQYAEWLARNHAVFEMMEKSVSSETLPEVHDVDLLRTTALETDLRQLLGADWKAEAETMARDSLATRRYLEHLEADASSQHLLLAHHFLQYNAVLSGGSYLGKMVSEKLSLVRGAPGVAFYAFRGVDAGKEAARVQKYLKAFDKVQLNEEERDAMLVAMQRIYADTEAMMKEVFDLNPVEGIAYSSAKEGGAESQPPPPCKEQLEISLSELHGFNGADGGRILFSLAGELLDVSSGSELYGPGGGYSLLAGRDVTRCLATMSLESTDLDDLAWEPDNAEEEKTLEQWREKLKVKYPVAGRLSKSPEPAAGAAGLRQRAAPAAPASTKPAAAAGGKTQEAPEAGGDTQKCPISGKEGAGCPMATFGIVKPKAKPKAAPKAGASSGFMAGKSLIAAVEEQQNSSDDWWLSRLCPLHWDASTMKAIVVVAVASWFSGIFVGWNLHKQLMS